MDALGVSLCGGDNNRNSHIAAASASQHVQGGYLELGRRA